MEHDMAYVDLMFPLLIDSILCLLAFLIGLGFGGHRADFNFLHVSREIRMEGERVIVVDFSSRGVFFEDFVFCAGKRLEIPLKVALFNFCALLDFL